LNVGALLSRSGVTHADRTALVYGDNQWSYSCLNERTNRLGNALLDVGLRKGESVALMQYNSPQLVESLFACFKAGLIVVPMNAKLHPSELSYIIRHSEARGIIYGEPFKATIEELRGELPDVNCYVSTTRARKRDIYYENLVSSGSGQPPEVDVISDDIAWLFYTSGTTGRPKGAMLTHRNLMEMTMNFLANVYAASKSDVALYAAPLTHGSGLYMLPLIEKGASNIILKSDSFEPGELFRTVDGRQVTVLPFLVPTMIKRLLLKEDIDTYDLSSLRCIVYGGSPIYLPDLKAAVKRFGNILVQIYGQGEAPMTISYLPKIEHVLDGDPEQSKRLLSAGMAQTSVEVRIVNAQEKELPAGQIGEIIVRGDVVMKGYWKDPAATAETLRNGWLHTGDIGYKDERGYIYIFDRKNDMIITGGSNVYSREVEDIISRHPDVIEVAVIGVPDNTWGEAVKAVVVKKPSSQVTEQEIIDFCKTAIASYKKPKSVEFVNELPKSAYGKVLRREIRDKCWIGVERRVH